MPTPDSHWRGKITEKSAKLVADRRAPQIWRIEKYLYKTMSYVKRNR
jgi:hypothetical protein